MVLTPVLAQVARLYSARSTDRICRDPRVDPCSPGCRICPSPTWWTVFLEDKGISLRRDREPIVVQHIPGNPGDGWNGSLIGAGNSATLTLVYNNATRDGWPGVVGWAEVCPAEPVTAA